MDLLPYCPKEIIDGIIRMVFKNGLQLPYKENVSFEDFDSYEKFKAYMRKRYWGLARVMREKDERNTYFARVALVNMIGDDEKGLDHLQRKKQKTILM